jgi:hypothetical protein
MKDFIGPAFSTNWRFLAKCYASYFSKNYVRIEKGSGIKLFWKAITQLWPSITSTNIARLEKGGSLPSTNTLHKIAKATGHKLMIAFITQPTTRKRKTAKNQ